jgi:hypothetical protein
VTEQREAIEVVPGQLALDLGESAAPVEPWADWSKEQVEAKVAMMPDPDEQAIKMGQNLPKVDIETVHSDFGIGFRVAPDLVPLLRPIGEFTPHPRNMRKHKLDLIAASLQAYGQQSPIVVQKSTGYICKGNGTYKTLVALGADRVAASVVDIDDETAWKYLLADNRTTDLSSYDADLLVQELEKLVDSGDFQGTLWTPDEAEDAIAEAGAVKVTAPFEFKGGYSETPESIAARAEKGKQSGTKLREVPVSMTAEEHTVFMAELKVLAKHFGTSGTIATIIEAVHRAYAGLPAAEPKPAKAEKPKKAKADKPVDLVEEATKVFEGDLAEPTEDELVAAVTN